MLTQMALNKWAKSQLKCHESWNGTGMNDRVRGWVREDGVGNKTNKNILYLCVYKMLKI